MDKEQAIQVVEQALDLATQKGAYNLSDVNQILMALSVLKTPKKEEE